MELESGAPALTRWRALLPKLDEEEHSPFWKGQLSGLVDPSARNRAVRLLMLVGLATFLPLGLKNLLIGEYLLALLLLTYAVALSVECVAYLSRGRGVFGYLVMGLLLACIAVAAQWVLGVYGTYWVFPIVTLLVFFSPPRVAAASNLLIIAGTAAVAFYKMDPLLAVRLLAALIIVAGIAHFVMNAILRLQSELLTLSTRDSLTQALNRTQLDMCLRQSLNDGAERPAAIAMLDIDNFKQINDRFGHDVGDQVITRVAECLDCHTRKQDLLFRLGGDEFLILFSDVTLDQAARVVEELRQEVLALEFEPGLRVTVSIGLQQGAPGLAPANWIKGADKALYQAKASGRNRAVLATD